MSETVGNGGRLYWKSRFKTDCGAYKKEEEEEEEEEEKKEEEEEEKKEEEEEKEEKKKMIEVHQVFTRVRY